MLCLLYSYMYLCLSVAQLIDSYDSGQAPDFSQVQPADVASVLKHFLRELPNPLLISPLYSNFLEITSTRAW